MFSQECFIKSFVPKHNLNSSVCLTKNGSSLKGKRRTVVYEGEVFLQRNILYVRMFSEKDTWVNQGFGSKHIIPPSDGKTVWSPARIDCRLINIGVGILLPIWRTLQDCYINVEISQHDGFFKDVGQDHRDPFGCHHQGAPQGSLAE